MQSFAWNEIFSPGILIISFYPVESTTHHVRIKLSENNNITSLENNARSYFLRARQVFLLFFLGASSYAFSLPRHRVLN